MNPSPATAARAHKFDHAKGGTRIFLLERLTSAALIPLILFFVGFIVALAPADYATVRGALHNPIVAVPLLLFIVVNGLHMQLGMRAIIEDYVHEHRWTRLCLLANIAFVLIVSAAAIFAVLKLVIGG